MAVIENEMSAVQTVPAMEVCNFAFMYRVRNDIIDIKIHYNEVGVCVRVYGHFSLNRLDFIKFSLVWFYGYFKDATYFPSRTDSIERGGSSTREDPGLLCFEALNVPKDFYCYLFCVFFCLTLAPMVFQ